MNQLLIKGNTLEVFKCIGTKKGIQMKKVVVLFGIDDFNPEIMQPEFREWKNLQKIITKCPKIKITGFCAACYSFPQNKYKRFFLKKISTFFQKNFENKNNLLTNNPAWVSFFNKEKNLSIQLHGFTHYTPISGTAEEFKGLNKKNTVDHMNSMLNEFQKFGLKATVFAPPGWAINKYVYEFCKKQHWCIASSFYNQKTNSFSGKKLNSGFKIQRIDGVKCIPRNVDIGTGTTEELDYAAKKGLISFHSHVKNIGVTNGLTEKNIANFTKLLIYLEKNYDPEYKFFNEL